MANSSALPGGSHYPPSSSQNFSSALPSHYVTALPVAKTTSKNNRKSSGKVTGSPPSFRSFPSGSEGFSTALPRVKQSNGRHVRNGFQPQPQLTPIPQFNEESAQVPSLEPAPTAAILPVAGQYVSHGRPSDGEGHFATALPQVKPTAAAKVSFTASVPYAGTQEHGEGGIAYAGHTHNSDKHQDVVKLSPGSRRMPSRLDSTESQILHNVKTIYNTFWGQSLTFHPFVHGDTPISFSKLWPDRRASLLDAFKEAELDKHPYEMCKLLLATNSSATLDALVEGKMLPLDRCLLGGRGQGNGHTLAHMACLLGLPDVVGNIQKRGGPKQQYIWNAKDENGHTPEEVCFKMEVRRMVKSMFGKRQQQGLVLKPEVKKLIFELAFSPNDFYRLVYLLQTYVFDVNSERNEDGDLLIHIAIKGGLPQLPLMFALVNLFKADLYQTDGKGNTPLTLAIKRGDEPLVEVCICIFGIAVNRRSSSEKTTPIHQAISASQPPIVSILLRRGSDPCAEDGEGREPLFLAKKLKAYESRQRITQFLKERMERLHQDAIAGRLEVSQLYESDLRAVCGNGCTLLMVAATHDHDHIVKQLLKRDVPIDFKQLKMADILDSLSDSFETSPLSEGQSCRDHTLKTAVHLAAEKGNLKCLQMLLNANAHPSMTDSSGMMPLHHAVDRGHIECVKLILNYPNTTLGLTGLKPALDLARENDFPEISQLLEQARERRQRELVSPRLFEIARSGDDEHILHVFENGDDVNPQNELEDWPLLVAARHGHYDVLVQLHQFGGHIARAHRKSKTTPLHEAAREGHTQVVKYLLQFCGRWNEGVAIIGGGVMLLPSGALDEDQAVDINRRNVTGSTPLELASGQGNTEIVRLLLEHKASTSLPDSTGRLVRCTAFAGTQFLIESHRKAHLQTLVSALVRRAPLDQFRQCWHGPSDFNLVKVTGDSLLLVAAASARLEVLKFLLQECCSIKPTQLVASHGNNSDVLWTSDPSEECTAKGHTRCFSDSLRETNSILRDQVTRSLRYSADEATKDNSADEARAGGRKTAMADVFTSPRRSSDRKRRAEEGERSHGRGLLAPGGMPPPKPPRAYHTEVMSTAAHPTALEDEQPHPLLHDNHVDNGVPQLDTALEREEQNEHFASLVRYTNPRDKQSMLHRAALNCRYDNIELLLETDSSLANLQDQAGNTALHIACSKCATKAGRLTVQTLLKDERVLTRLKNLRQELPEQQCMRSATRKLIIRTRQARNEPEPVAPADIEPSTVEENLPGATGNGGLEHIMEKGGLDEPFMSNLTRRMEQMKMERQEELANQKTSEGQEEGVASPPT